MRNIVLATYHQPPLTANKLCKTEPWRIIMAPWESGGFVGASVLVGHRSRAMHGIACAIK
jgi:hypothetical protein